MRDHMPAILKWLLALSLAACHGNHDADNARNDICKFHTKAFSGAWTLRNANGSIALKSQVPGYALQTLQDRGHLQDPLHGLVSALRSPYQVLQPKLTWLYVQLQ